MPKKSALVHWADDVADNDIAELADIKASIGGLLNKTAECLIEIGNKLNRARVLIPGDLQFGHWREEMTPFTARQAQNYMKVARKFSSHSLVEKTSMSILVELTAAEDLAPEVEAAIDRGEDVKRADIQKAKREGKSVDEVLEEKRQKDAVKGKKIKEQQIEDAEFIEAQADKARDEARDANNLPPIGPSVSRKMATEPPLVTDHIKEVYDAVKLPDGDYEMLAVTEDEYDLVITALEHYQDYLDESEQHDQADKVQNLADRLMGK